MLKGDQVYHILFKRENTKKCWITWHSDDVKEDAQVTVSLNNLLEKKTFIPILYSIFLTK